MLPQSKVRDVGEDSQEDEVFRQDTVTDEVFHRDAGTESELSLSVVITGGEPPGEVFHQDAGTEDEVEVLSSRKSFQRKSTTSLSARSRSSSQPSTGLKGDTESFNAGNTSLMKPTRRRSKAVIEAEDDDDENLSKTLPPPESQAEVDVESLESKAVANSPSQMSNNGVYVLPSCPETIETMIFTNSLLQTCAPPTSNLSASAQEFQPRIQGETWKAGDLLSTSFLEAPSCLPYQYQVPLPPPSQSLCHPVNQHDSLLCHSMQDTGFECEMLGQPPTLSAVSSSSRPFYTGSRLANTWSSGQLDVALSSAAMAMNPEQELWMPRQGGFVDQLIEFQQGSFFTQQEISPENKGFVGYQNITAGERLGCDPLSQGKVKTSLGKHLSGEPSNLSSTKSHLPQGGGDSSERLRQEKGPVYVPPHRKVNTGRQRDVNLGWPSGANWKEKFARFQQQAPVRNHQAYGLERTVNFNRSLPVSQNQRRDRGGEQRRNVVDCERSIRPLMADCESRELKSELEESRCSDRNKSADKMKLGQQPEEVAGARKQVGKKSLGQSTSSEKNKSEESSVEMKGNGKENVERSLPGRKSSKEKSGSEKKKSSGKKKGKFAAKRSPSPQDPPTLSSKSIQAKCRNNERLDCSDCSSSGYSFDRKQSKPALRLKMPAKVLHRGKVADVCSGRDGCTIGGSCSSLVRTATGGLAHPSSCSSLEEKFPSLPRRLLSHSGSDSTRNTWSGEKLTASLDSLPSYGDSPHSTSWAEEVEEMQPSKSFASLFNSSFNSSPTLPRTPPTPWNPADESCCSEPDTFSTASHRLPGYKICRKELSKGSVWDSHCHLDFLARKLSRENIKGGESLQMSLESDGQKLAEKFGGCIANFCDPRDWAQGPRSQEVSKILTSCKEQSGVFLTLGCHPHFADKMDGFCVQQLMRLAKKMKGRVVAIGECGLDKSGKNRVPMETQKKYFEAQIDIARELNLPLVLHIRGAEDEAKELLEKKKVPANFRIHYHCFTGTWKAAEAWLGAYPASKIGLTGLVTFDHARSVHEVARHIPLEKLLLETDAPYFLPSGVSKESYKHTFSQPGHVVHVAAQVAALRRISLAEVLAANRKNIKDIYDC